MTKYHIFSKGGTYIFTTKEFKEAKEWAEKGLRIIIMTELFNAELTNKPFEKI